MKLYDAGAFLIIGIVGLLTALYGTFREQPAPPAPCKVWYTERTSDGREKSYCADGE